MIMKSVMFNFFITIYTDANEIMRLVKRRFPQAQLAPYTSEEDMINGIRRWRRNYTDTLKDFFEENTDADDVLRFDTCINGYGMLHVLNYIYILSHTILVCIFVSGTAEKQLFELIYVISLTH